MSISILLLDADRLASFLLEFLHVISNYTFEQVVFSNKGSIMAPLMVGATESDMPWEVGLR